MSIIIISKLFVKNQPNIPFPQHLNTIIKISNFVLINSRKSIENSNIVMYNKNGL